MKKIIVFIALLGISSPLLAQLRVGPKIGGQLSRVAFEDKTYYNTHSSQFLPGIVAGGILNYRVNRLLSLETELLYTQNRRYIVREDPYKTVVKNKSMYHYLNVPVLLRLSGHTKYKGNRLEYYVNMGPQLMWWLGGSGKIEHDEIQEELAIDVMPYTIYFVDEYSEITNHTEKLAVKDANVFQMALDIGAGVVFDLGFGHGIVLDFRGSYGIGRTYLAESPGSFGPIDYEDNMEGVNHSIAVTVGYIRDIDFYALLRKGKRGKTSH